MSNGAQPHRDTVVKITPSEPGTFTYKNFRYEFSTAQGELLCSCTHPVGEDYQRAPRLSVAQGLETFQVGVAQNGTVTDTFKRKCPGVVLVQLKDAVTSEVIYSARAFPRDRMYDPWADATLPRTPQ